MKIEKYGHYFKTTKNSNKVLRITVLEFIDENNIRCSYGHISPSDNIQGIIHLPPRRITDTLSEGQKKYLDYRDEEKRRKKWAKERKERKFRAYIERMDTLVDELSKQRIFIPCFSVYAFEEYELKQLLNNLDYYIPERKAGDAFKVFGYNRKYDAYDYIAC